MVVSGEKMKERARAGVEFRCGAHAVFPGWKKKFAMVGVSLIFRCEVYSEKGSGSWFYVGKDLLM